MHDSTFARYFVWLTQQLKHWQAKRLWPILQAGVTSMGILLFVGLAFLLFPHLQLDYH